MKDAEGGSQARLVALVPMIPATSAIIISPNALWVRIMSFIPPLPRDHAAALAAPSLVGDRRCAGNPVPRRHLRLRLGAGSLAGLLQFDRLLSFKEIGRMLRKDY